MEVCTYQDYNKFKNYIVSESVENTPVVVVIYAYSEQDMIYTESVYMYMYMNMYMYIGLTYIGLTYAAKVEISESQSSKEVPSTRKLLSYVGPTSVITLTVT